MPTTQNFKKGEQAWMVTSSNEQHAPFAVVFFARKITLTSWGKKQGTAVDANDKNLQYRISPRWTTLCRTEADVQAYAATHGEAWSAQDIAHRIKINEGWMQSTAERSRAAHGEKYVDEVKRELAELRAATPSFRVIFKS